MSGGDAFLARRQADEAAETEQALHLVMDERNDALSRIDSALGIDPEAHATKSRDYGRGFAEAIRLVREALTPVIPTMRHSFTDSITWTNVTLVIPPGGVVFPAPGEPKIGVEHPGCPDRGDLALQYDAWYCPRCRWSGRIIGRWAAEMIERAPVTPSRTDKQPPTSVAGAKGGLSAVGPDEKKPPDSVITHEGTT